MTNIDFYKPIALILALMFFITLGVQRFYNPIKNRRQSRPSVKTNVPLEEPKTNVEAVFNLNSAVSNEKEYWTNVIAR